MKNIGKMVKNVLSVVVVACIVLAAVVIAGPRVLGWQPYKVLSGSMEPTYPVNSVIYVKKADPQEVRVNDPITFYLQDEKTVVTHRVVKIDTQKQCFYTKGDANNVEDGGTTPYSRLIGKPMFSIPKLGYVTSFVTTKQGMILVCTGFICLLIIVFLPELLMKAGKKNKGENSNENKGETVLDGESKGG
ncbi:MAG TPA: signal peptidase I [Oscillospiraceae bacterium]|nr:signal peptidase I [Oscillospiraceae bacterium]